MAGESDDWKSFLFASNNNDDDMEMVRTLESTAPDSRPSSYFGRRKAKAEAAKAPSEFFGITPVPPSKRIQLPSRQRKALHRRLAPSNGGAASAVYLRPQANLENMTNAGMHSERKSLSTKSRSRVPSMSLAGFSSARGSKVRKQPSVARGEGRSYSGRHGADDMASVNSGLTLDDTASLTTSHVTHSRAGLPPVIDFDDDDVSTKVPRSVVFKGGPRPPTIVVTTEEIFQRRSAIIRKACAPLEENDLDFLSEIRVQPGYIDVMSDPALFQYVVPSPGNPYELNVVGGEDLLDPTGAARMASEFCYTLSSNGLTRVYASGGGDTEHISLVQWCRERAIYSVLKEELTLFRSFRAAKSFRLWVQAMGKAKSSRSGDRISKDLFSLQPLYRKCLDEVQAACVDITNIELLDVDMHRAHGLTALEEVQGERHARCRMQLQMCIDRAKDAIVNACERSLSSALQASGFDGTGQGGVPVPKNLPMAPSSPPRVPLKNSLGSGSYTEVAATNSHCRKLAKFIRLCELQIVESHIDSALSSVQLLLARMRIATETSIDSTLKGVPKTTQRFPGDVEQKLEIQLQYFAERLNRRIIEGMDVTPVFELELNSFGALASLDHERTPTVSQAAKLKRALGQVTPPDCSPNLLAYSPDDEGLKSAIETHLFDALGVVTKPPRLVQDPDLRKYMASTLDEMPLVHPMSLETIILMNGNFQASLEQMHFYLTEVFVRAITYSQTFEPILKTFINNQQFRVGCKPDSIHIDSKQELTDMVKLLKDFETQEAIEFVGLRKHADLGLVRVNTDMLEELLRPSPRLCLSDLHRALPIVYRRTCDAFSDEVTATLGTISVKATTVAQHVELLKALKAVNTGGQEKIEAEFKVLKSFHTMMVDHNIPLAAEVRDRKDKISQLLDNFRSSMHKAEQTAESDSEAMVAEYMELVRSLQPPMEKLSFDVDDDSVSSLSSIEILDVMVDRMTQGGQIVRDLRAKAAVCVEYEAVLGTDAFDPSEIEEVGAKHDLLEKLWVGLGNWLKTTSRLRTQTVERAKVVELNETVDKYSAVVDVCLGGLVDEEEGRSNAVAKYFHSIVENFRHTVLVVGTLQATELEAHHWKAISGVANFDVQAEGCNTVGYFLDMKIRDQRSTINDITNNAHQERLLYETLNGVIGQWKDCNLEVQSYKGARNTFVLDTGVLDDIYVRLDDSQITVDSILRSKYVDPLKQEVLEWKGRLELVRETLEEWVRCQLGWETVEPIFSNYELRKQLQAENVKFMAIDYFFKSTMRLTKDEPSCMTACTTNDLLDKFRLHNASLEKLNSSLFVFMEEKRLVFPRFYFVSDPQLVALHAQAMNPKTLQPHIRNLFACVHDFSYSMPGSINGIIGMQDEQLDFAIVKARGPLEQWLADVEFGIGDSLRRQMRTALSELLAQQAASAATNATNSGRGVHPIASSLEWLLDQTFPSQCMLAVVHIQWQQACQRAFKDELPLVAFRSVLDGVQQSLDMLVRANHSLDFGFANPARRCAISLLLITVVHLRDTMETMVAAAHVETSLGTTSFVWESLLRFEWMPSAGTGEVIIKQNNVTLEYGYEFMGTSSRLVVTPLTQRCWLAITTALAVCSSCSCFGPTGSGKSEICSDLARLLGKHTVMYNCSEQLGESILSRLIGGVIQCGSWLILDEVNRGTTEILSVLASHMQDIRNARLLGLEKMAHNDRDVILRPHHLITTMNPDYRDRVELPGTLRSCLRPIALLKPDVANIAEVLLFSSGFETSSMLAYKLVHLFDLCADQLQQEARYDFSVRAMRRVISWAGRVKHQNPISNELDVLMQAIVGVVTPLLLASDLPIFNALLHDLCPDFTGNSIDQSDLKNDVKTCFIRRGMQLEDKMLNKVIEVHDISEIVFGTALVGNSGSGKTTALRILEDLFGMIYERNKGQGKDKGAAGRDLLSRLNMRGSESEGLKHFSVSYALVNSNTINPKCLSVSDLFGSYNEITHIWEDGIVPFLVRAAITNAIKRHWIVLDGPMDAVWAESFNTALDAHRLLCLSNGERINVAENTSFFFEMDTLENANPATISRMGVVYFPVNTVSWEHVAVSWLERIATKYSTIKALPQIKGRMWKNFEVVVKPLINLLRRECTEPFATTNVQQIQTLCAIFDSLIIQFLPAIESAATDDDLALWMDNLFIFSCVWGVGGAIQSDERDFFSLELREILDQREAGRTMHLPRTDTVFDHVVDSKEIGIGSGVFICAWRHWSEVLDETDELDVSPLASFEDVFVPTVQSTAMAYLVSHLLELGRPILMTGINGCGKTSTMSHILSGIQSQQVDASQIGMGSTARYESKLKRIISTGFSARTTAGWMQHMVEQKLHRVNHDILGSPPGHENIIFIDDINLSAVDANDSQSVSEFMRQLLERQGFYDSGEHYWKNVVDTKVVAAATCSLKGQNSLDQRLLQKFSVLFLPSPSRESIRSIYSKSVLLFMERHDDAKLQRLAPHMVSAAIDLYERVIGHLRPTPTRFHYIFSLREISLVFRGLFHVESRCMDSTQTAARMWVHEAIRVFHDRLVDEREQQWFMKEIFLVANQNFKYIAPQLDHGEFNNKESALMCHDFIEDEDQISSRAYKECTNLKNTRAALDSFLEEFNDAFVDKGRAELVFFFDAVGHIARFCRILKQRGNVLLIGGPGCGKKTVVRLGSFISGHKVEEVLKCTDASPPPHYYRDHLKHAVMKSALESTKISYLVSDSELPDDDFLAQLNTVVNRRTVGDFFSVEEEAEIIVHMRPIMKLLGLSDESEACWSRFLYNIRSNFRIVLCMQTKGESLRSRLRSFPSLVSCTEMDWYHPLPVSSLNTVGETFLSASLPASVVPQAMVGAVAATCASTFHGVCNLAKYSSYADTSMRGYFEMLRLYRDLLLEKATEIRKRRENLLDGMKKLEESGESVAGMKESIEELKPLLHAKSEDMDRFIEQDSERLAASEAETLEVAKAASLAESKAAEVGKVKAEAELELADAQPALNAARQALNALDANGVIEMKRYMHPPQAVQDVMDLIVDLHGGPLAVTGLTKEEAKSHPEKVTPWAAAKKLLNRSKFVEELHAFDVDAVPDGKWDEITAILDAKDLRADNIVSVSLAASGLCNWVNCLCKFAITMRLVRPKVAALKKLEDSLAALEEDLAAKREALQIAQEANAVIDSEHQQIKDDHAKVTADVEQLHSRLANAEELTSSLEDERVAWLELTNLLEEKLTNLPSTCIMAAATVSLMGTLSTAVRKAAHKIWADECKTNNLPWVTGELELGPEDYATADIFEGELETLKLLGGGADAELVEDALIATKAPRWTYLIDPHHQALSWIRKYHPDTKVEESDNPQIMELVAECMESGTPICIRQHTDRLEPRWLSLLRCSRLEDRSGGFANIKMHKNFRLSFLSALPTPAMALEVADRVTVVNFELSHPRLEHMLLTKIMELELPDVEIEHNAAQESILADKTHLAELEHTILKRLNDSSGYILDDVEMVTALRESREISETIKARLDASYDESQFSTTVRNKFQPLAARAAALFLALTEFSQINVIYAVSFEYFMKRFASLSSGNRIRRHSGAGASGGRNSPSQEVDYASVDVRLLELNEAQKRLVVDFAPGVFEKDYLPFLFWVIAALLIHDKKVSREEWLYFLGHQPARSLGMLHRQSTIRRPSQMHRGSVSSTRRMSSSHEVAPPPELIAGKPLDRIQKYAKGVAAFSGIVESFVNDSESWFDWKEMDRLYLSPMPNPWNNTLSRFQKMLLIQQFRPDQAFDMMRCFVGDFLGAHDLGAERTAVSLLEGGFEKVDAMTPLLVLLGDAADPTTALFAVAKKRGAEMVRVSFTQSQTHEATNAVDAAQKHGHWVLFENCNMVPSWTPMLEAMVQSLTTMQNVNQDFRLLLSTRPFEGFSIAVLHRSVRVVVETSRGIRATCASLMSVESDIDQRAWEDVASAIGAKPSYGLLFRLVLFHSVLQERRKFGPAGFNAAYHFNLNDFSTAQTAVQQYISSVVETKADPADGTEGEVLGRTIKSIQHLIGSVVYGGHVTDIWDQRCIEATMYSMFHVPSMGSDDDVFDSIGINALSNVELPGNFNECRDAVNSLPYDEQPDLFGMHCSSTRYWIHTQGTAASDLLKLVHSKKRTQSKASGHTTSEDTATQSAALKLLHALPVNLPKEGRFRFRNHDSTHITILQETTKFNNLLNCMRDSLHYLCNALLGKIVMTEAHDVMSTALVAGTVPTAWRDLSFESTKSLSAWFSELRLRVEYLSHWKDTGHPIVVALPVLYYPRAFLWTATQNYARKHFIALDNLSFKFEPHTHSSSKLEEEPRDGIFVAGFVLEGARWDAGSGALEDLAPEDFVSQAPAFHFIPTVNYKPNPLNFMCPMYHTSERSRLKSSNFIVAVEFRSHGNSLKWVLQGVALILDIDADGSEVGKLSSTSGGVTTD